MDGGRSDAGAEVVEVACPPGCSLTYVWGRASEIKTATLWSHGFAAEQTVTATISWGVPDEGCRQSLVSLSQLYTKLKRSLQSGMGRPSGKDVDKFVQECIQYAKGQLDPSTPGQTVGCDAALTELAAWELMEVIFTTFHRRKGFFPYALVAWYTKHSRLLGGKPSGDLSNGHARGPWSRGGDNEEEDREFWTQFLRLVALGLWTQARQLLCSHPAWETQDAEDAALTIVNNIMLRRPFMAGCSLLAGDSLSFEVEGVEVLEAEHSRWLGVVEEALRNNLPAWRHQLPDVSLYLELFLELVSGKDHALRSCTDNWHQYVVASLLHRYPFFDADGLCGVVDASQIMNKSAARWEPGTFLEDFMRYVGANEGTSALGAVLDPGAGLSGWCRVHLGTLLEALMGCRWEAQEPALGLSAPEHAALEFVSGLCPSTVADRMAMVYLTECGVTGMRGAERVMDSALFKIGDPDIPSAVSICGRLGLDWSRRNLCASVGISQLCVGLYGSGMGWLLAGGNQRLVECFLEEVVNVVEDVLRGGLKHFDVELESIPELLILAPFFEAVARQFPGLRPVAFLHRFANFQSAASDLSRALASPPASPALRSAARGAILDLLKPGACPEGLRLAVLHRAVPLLEDGCGVFGAEDVWALLRALPRAGAGGAGGAVAGRDAERVRKVLLDSIAKLHADDMGAVGAS